MESEGDYQAYYDAGDEELTDEELDEVARFGALLIYAQPEPEGMERYRNEALKR